MKDATTSGKRCIPPLKKRCIILVIIATLLALSGCAETTADVVREPTVLEPSASGKTVYAESNVTVDASNVSQGYLMVKCDGGKRVKAQIDRDSAGPYTYDIRSEKWEVLPLTQGDGNYTVNIYENVVDSQYVLVLGESVDVELENEFLPFLYPNQYVDFSTDSKAVGKCAEIVNKSGCETEIIDAVYEYISKNIRYDTEKATEAVGADIQEYMPDIDATLAAGKGICLDYAALMTAMLRSQRIPARLEVGYATVSDETIYHAWTSVYTETDGWTLLDPTFAATADGFTRRDLGEIKYHTLYMY